MGHTITSDNAELVFEQWCDGDSADWFFQSHLLDSAAKRGQLFKVAKNAFLWQILLAIFSPSFFELFCPNHNRLTMWSFQSDRMSWRNLVHFLFFAKIWTKENVTFLFLSLKEEEKEKKITLQDFFSEFEMRRLLSFLALVQLCWIWLSRI